MNKQILLFETVVGSQAYGTAVEGSDVDMKGIYAQHPEDLMSFGYKPQKQITKDEQYFELKRFVELAKSSNPTVIELLWMPEECVKTVHPAFQYLIDNRDVFLTKQCRHSFGGYAVQQIKKAKGLDKKMNWENNRISKKNIIDFCYAYDGKKSHPLLEYLKSKNIDHENCGIVNLPHFRDCFNLFHSEDPEFSYKGIEGKNYNLKLSSVPKGQQPLCLMHYNKDGFIKHCKDYKSYQVWLKERNTQRYIDLKEHGQKIDGKNMLHCIRLIDEAIEIAEQKTINVRRPNADYLISIRKGKVNLEDIINKAEEGIEKMDEAFKNSTLPNKIDEEKVNQILIEARRLIKWN